MSTTKLILRESPVPPTPASGYVHLYPKEDGKLYSKDDTGTEYLFSTMNFSFTTEQATTTGTSIEFTNFPANLRRITIQLVGITTSGTSPFLLQIGDSGALATAGYLSGASTGQGSNNWVTTANTNGFLLVGSINNETDTFHGAIVLTLEKVTTFRWVSQGMVWNPPGILMHPSAGSKALNGALTRIRFTTVNGSDTFEAGVINIMYETGVVN